MCPALAASLISRQSTRLHAPKTIHISRRWFLCPRLHSRRDPRCVITDQHGLPYCSRPDLTAAGTLSRFPYSSSARSNYRHSSVRRRRRLIRLPAYSPARPASGRQVRSDSQLHPNRCFCWPSRIPVLLRTGFVARRPSPVARPCQVLTTRYVVVAHLSLAAAAGNQRFPSSVFGFNFISSDAVHSVHVPHHFEMHM